MKSVSIILPVYNVERYIGDCIKSIINQTSQDFEVVIVDDGSKDNSINIAIELLKKTSVTYKLVGRSNGGLSAARNTGIKNSDGEYLCFVDSDDVIHPEYVEVLLNDIKANNCDLAIANYKDVFENTKFDFDNRVLKGEIVDKNVFLKQILKRKIFNYFGCFIIKKTYIISHNLWFDETVFFGVDQAYMWKLMVEVDKYSYNYKIIYNYFERPGSIMTSTKVDRMLTGLPSLMKCAEELKNNPYFDSSLIVERWKISALHTIAKSFCYKDFAVAFTKFNPSKFKIIFYPDIRVRLVGLSMLFGKRLTYFILKRN